MNAKTLGIVAVVLAIIVAGFLFFPLPQPVIELRPEAIFTLAGLTITNTILTAWIVIALLILILFLGTRKLTLIPSGFQNGFEAIVEGFGNIVNGVAGEKNGRRFFPVVFIFFLYIVVNNWAALTPIYNMIGKVENEYEHVHHEAEEHPDFVVEEEEEIHGYIMKKGSFTYMPLFERTKLVEVHIPEGTSYAERARLVDEELERKLGAPFNDEEQTYGLIAPYLRSLNTDINAPLAYAIWSFFFVEFWGITALGVGVYLGKFFNLKGIGTFVGLLEFVSELSRIISFTFRLFGNIFAGEVLLFMMSFLVSFVLIDVFYGLELFVGLIQGFVFAMLTLVFAVGAVSHHDDGHDQGAEHGPHGAEAHTSAAAH